MRFSIRGVFAVGILFLLTASVFVFLYTQRTGTSKVTALPTLIDHIVSTTTDISKTDGASIVMPPLSERTPAPVEVDEQHRKYTNEKYHFSFVYPKELEVQEYEERGGAITVIFESQDGTEGINVYVVPYTERTISEERFRIDQPSGVFLNPKDITMHGVQAVLFNGENTVMGETSEIWFLNGGYLYEIATYKSKEALLEGIVRSWRFI